MIDAKDAVLVGETLAFEMSQWVALVLGLWEPVPELRCASSVALLGILPAATAAYLGASAGAQGAL